MYKMSRPLKNNKQRMQDLHELKVIYDQERGLEYSKVRKALHKAGTLIQRNWLDILKQKEIENENTPTSAV